MRAGLRLPCESKHGRVVRSGTCDYCGDRILWVRTPKHRTMPVDFDNPDLSHFATCTEYTRADRRADATAPGQLSLFDVAPEPAGADD